MAQFRAFRMRLSEDRGSCWHRPIPFVLLSVAVLASGCGGGGGSSGTSNPSANPSAVVMAPSITAQPQSATVQVGQSVTFTVTASGSSPLLYQWARKGAVINGATSS